METSPKTLDVSPSIREAVGPDVEIIMDCERGTDICKVLALAGGTEGVIKAHNILKVDLDRAIGLLGTGTVDDLKNRGLATIKKRNGNIPDRHAFDVAMVRYFI